MIYILLLVLIILFFAFGRYTKAFRFMFPLMRNDPTSQMVDGILSAAVRRAKSGKKHKLELDSYYATLTFEDGYVVRWWIANKMYAYAHEGHAKVNGVMFPWRSALPSRETAWQLEELIAEYFDRI